MTEFDKIMSFELSNKLVYDSLCNELIDGMRVLPFVGAGISAFAYDTWRQFLINMSIPLGIEEQEYVRKSLDSDKYFAVADFLCEKYGNLLFYKKIQEAFAENKIDDDILKNNAAFLVPKICKGNCITTNFDRVMEHACNANGIIPDKALPTDTNQLNQYLRGINNSSALIFKIHGDIMSNQDDIILTEKSYEKHYSENSQLRKQLNKWIDNKKLIFLGASLKSDKTVEIIKSRMEEGMHNYTIYGCNKEDIPRLKKHFESLSIMAIFYDLKNHNNLNTVLEHLIKDSNL